jgi:hypothetical protein
MFKGCIFGKDGITNQVRFYRKSCQQGCFDNALLLGIVGQDKFLLNVNLGSKDDLNDALLGKTV